MLRNMKVGTKLGVVLTPLIVVLVLLATIGVSQRRAVADDAARVEQLTEFVTVDSDLVNALQVESIWSAAFVSSTGDVYRSELDNARKATDDALSRYNEAKTRINPGKGSEATQVALKNADTRLANLSTNRNSVNFRQTNSVQAVDGYSNTTADLVTVNAAIVQQANEPTLLRGLNTVVNLERVKDARAKESAFLTGVVVKGAFTAKDGTVCEDVTGDCESYTKSVQAGGDASQADKTFEQGGATPEEK